MPAWFVFLIRPLFFDFHLLTLPHLTVQLLLKTSHSPTLPFIYELFLLSYHILHINYSKTTTLLSRRFITIGAKCNLFVGCFELIILKIVFDVGSLIAAWLCFHLASARAARPPLLVTLNIRFILLVLLLLAAEIRFIVVKCGRLPLHAYAGVARYRPFRLAHRRLGLLFTFLVNLLLKLILIFRGLITHFYVKN